MTFQYSSSCSSKNRSALATEYRNTMVRLAFVASGTQILKTRFAPERSLSYSRLLPA